MFTAIDRDTWAANRQLLMADGAPSVLLTKADVPACSLRATLPWAAPALLRAQSRTVRPFKPSTTRSLSFAWTKTTTTILRRRSPLPRRHIAFYTV